MDTAAPVLLDTRVVDGALVLTYNEPVGRSIMAVPNDDFAVTVDGLRVDENNAYFGRTAGDYTVTIPLAPQYRTIGKHDVVVYNSRDLVYANGSAGNKNPLIKTSYEIKTGVAPTVVSITPVQDDFNSFVVKFSEPVHDAKVTVKKGNTEFFDTVVTTGPAKTVVVHVPLASSTAFGTNGVTNLYEAGESSVSLSVAVAGYEDSDHIVGAKYTNTVTLSKDSHNPTVPNQYANYLSYGWMHEGRINVAFDRGLTSVDATKITVVDKNGISRTLDKDEVEINSVNTNIVSIKLVDYYHHDLSREELEALAPFTVKFEAGAVALGTNYDEYNHIFTSSIANKELTTKVLPTPSEAFKAVEAVDYVSDVILNSYGQYVIKVGYNTTMGASAANLANYSLDGDAMPAGTKISMDGANRVVTITFADETFANTIQKKLVISKNVLTADGSIVVGKLATKEAYQSQLLTLTDNVKPVLVGAAYGSTSTNPLTGAVTTNQIRLTFSESLTGVYDGDDFAVSVNGASKHIESATISGNTVTLTVEPINVKENSADVRITDNDITDLAGNTIIPGQTATAAKK